MNTAQIKLYSLNYSELKTYIVAICFIVGNVLLPQMFHMVPKGGIIWLPIYFFTLIGAYKYGWKAGLLTAVMSPLVNSLLFSMPSASVLPAILVKSVLLALCAGLAARYFKKVSIMILLSVVLSYQLVGTLAEWLMIGDLYAAIQDFRIGIPGMLLQVVGGYLIIKHVLKK